MAGDEFVFITDDIIKAVLREVNSQVFEAFHKFSTHWQQSATRRELMADVNKRVAAGAQNAVVEAYQASPIGKQESYRGNDTGKWRRFSGNRMRNALSSPRFQDSDKDGIYFGNISFLDSQAKQWYRLNFGADGTNKSKAGRSPGVGSMRFFGKAISKRVDLSDYPPSEAFFIPKGAVFSSDFMGSSGRVRGVPRGAHGTSALYVLGAGGASLKRVTKNDPKPSVFRRRQMASGIRGGRFLEAGARYINENYGKEVTEVANTWFRESKRRMR